MRWYRKRCGRRGRRPKPVFVGFDAGNVSIAPVNGIANGFVELMPDELETLRLVDLKGLTQAEAGEKMGISRGTIWRLLQSARKKVTMAIVNNMAIHIISKSEQPNSTES